jgi:multidrug efflux pump subunit AcrA (membrane-fusion protein)
MNTEVDVENPTLVLIPGMYAEVNLILDQAVNVLCVPLTAVDSGTESSDSANSADKGHAGTVMMVTADNHIATRKVRLGLETSNFIEVISGLSEGDMVVIGNRANLQQGQEVKPKLTSLSASSADGAETK